MRTQDLLAAIAAIGPIASSAAALTVDPSDSVVYLRKTCDVNYCFTSTAALTTWLWGAGSGDRLAPPSSTDHVVVRVGPGTSIPSCAKAARPIVAT